MVDGLQPKLDVRNLMEAVAAEARRRQAAAGAADSLTEEVCLATELLREDRRDVKSDGPLEGSRFEFKAAGYRLDDFFQYHDGEFVKNAYLGILGRQPDAGGYESYLAALRTTRLSKAEILGRLRYAPEGKARKVKIKGLLPMFVAHTLFRVPVLGYVARLITGIFNLPGIIRNMQTSDNVLGSQMVGFQRDLQRLDARLSELVRAWQNPSAQADPGAPPVSGSAGSEAVVGPAALDATISELRREIYDHQLRLLELERRLEVLLAHVRRRSTDSA